MSETLAARLFDNARRLGSRPAHYFSAGGRWVPVGWSTFGRIVEDLASGLMALGHEQGDAVAIMANTRREWIYFDVAAQAAGGVTVGVYPTLTIDQAAYVVGHADCKYAVVEDKAQLIKLQAARAQLPALRAVIVIDRAGVELGGELISMDQLAARGRAERHDVAARVAAIHSEDAALFVYTSGTTGPPKGAMLTHGNVTAALQAARVAAVEPGDVGFSFLPLAHVLQRVVDYRGIWDAVAGYYARGLDTVAEDLASAAPTVMASVPRIFEKIHAAIIDQVRQGSPMQQRVFQWAVAVGSQVTRLRRDGAPLPPALAAQYRVAHKLVFGKLRAKLGGRVRWFLTGGAPIAPDILEFFHAADIAILEGWGMTETFGLGTLNLPEPGGWKIGSIGRAAPGVDLRIDADGELLIKGPNVFSGYYKQEAATRESFTSDGYFRTGDVVTVDADGFYYIVDRKKDLIITAGGKNIAPQNIENLMKSDPLISQCVVIGDRKPYLVALVAVDDAQRGSQSDDVLRQRVAAAIAARNPELATYEQIKKFRLLPRDLSQEAGELTPTLKVKRKVVADRYAHLIDEMYAEGKPRQRRQPSA